MDTAGIESHQQEEDEDISDRFVCCVCLDLLYKPIVLCCGHISCFWCVHKSMSPLRESHCPICRNPYRHFPTICQLLHFLLRKMYPIAYNRRELQILEEEKREGDFSPQFDDANACSLLAKQGLHHSGKSKLEKSSVNSGQLELSSPAKACPMAPEECPVANNEVTGTFTDSNINCSQNQVSGFCKQITVEDVLCAGCKELLFCPVVLNCGHVYCESCLIHDGVIRCEVCQSLHPKGLANVSLELAQFLEERFPKEYTSRRDVVQLKQVDSKRLKEAETQADNVPVLGDRESIVHVGCGCDFCGMCPIVGDRYKCKDCVERIGFDLCGDCYRTNSKLPGRFNQQHTPEHKFELIRSTSFHQILLRFRAVSGQVMYSTTDLVIDNNTSEESEDGSTPLSLTGSTQETVENGMAAPDSSPGVEQDRNDSQPTT